jgi:hypothetical protein
MMKTHFACWCAALSTFFALGTVGCSVQESANEQPTGPAPVQTTTAAGEDRPFDGRLLEIAGSYTRYRRVGDEIGIAAPCATIPRPPTPRFSMSEDSSTHGKKLYWLFVKEFLPDSPVVDYVVAGKPNPIGQVVVKEAWDAEEVRDEEGTVGTRDRPLVRYGGHTYRQGDLAGLFIMYKLDPKTPGTDNGWVYGTVTADGKAVTSAGRVESCMRCNQDAPHDRLFGVAKK